MLEESTISLFQPPSSPSFGAKAYNLYRAEVEGLHIPRTWALSCEYAASIIDRYCGTGNQPPCADRLRRIQNFLSKDIYSTPEFSELCVHVSKLVKSNSTIKSYAIRSSHCLEDGIDKSFSGLFSTYLHISRCGDIARSIVKCWASSFTQEIDAYLENGTVEATVCSVIVQEFVPSVKSGILFKTEGAIIINATWGLGSSIADGDSGYDEWIIKEDGRTVYSNIKNRIILPIFQRVNPAAGSIISSPCLPGHELRVAAAEKAGNIMIVELDDTLKALPTLSELELRELVGECEKLSERLSIPQCDIEWTFREGRPIILQIRPLTRVPDVSHRNSTSSTVAIPLVSGRAIGPGYKVENETQAKKFPAGAIVIARRLTGPVIMAANKASGCIIASRSPLSHSAIIAREIGLPSVGAVDISSLSDGKIYEIDGGTGSVMVREKAPDAMSKEHLSPTHSTTSISAGVSLSIFRNHPYDAEDLMDRFSKLSRLKTKMRIGKLAALKLSDINLMLRLWRR